MINENSPIGFFDSGLGGISVLRKSKQIMPEEDYIYFGDSLHAPYGEKSRDEIVELSLNAIDILYRKEVKAIVVACNTATAYAIEKIRALYEDKIPIIGIEPAVKIAVETESKNIIVLATNATVKEESFLKKVKQYSNKYNIISIGAPKLVEFVEKGMVESIEIEEYLKKILKDYLYMDDLTIVLGCTHFPFTKRSIKKVLTKDVALVDGSEGTCKRLKDKLIKHSIKRNLNNIGNISFLNSLNSDKIINICENLLKLDI